MAQNRQKILSILLAASLFLCIVFTSLFICEKVQYNKMAESAYKGCQNNIAKAYESLSKYAETGENEYLFSSLGYVRAFLSSYAVVSDVAYDELNADGAVSTSDEVFAAYKMLELQLQRENDTERKITHLLEALALAKEDYSNSYAVSQIKYVCQSNIS